MKKKLITFLTAALGFATLACLTACGHEHEYTAKVTAPTCTEKGYTTHTCECGESYVDSYVDELGHEYTDYTSDNNATYDSDGTKTATCNRESCEETDTVTDTGTKLKSYIAFKTLQKDGDVWKGKYSNATTEFSFGEEINEIGNAEFFVSTDQYGTTSIFTKTVSLATGNNVFYVFETVDDDYVVHKVELYRLSTYQVQFSTQGSEIESQTVEEESLAIEPNETPTRAGYTFNGWDYDFSSPILQSITISAKWTANTNTSYKVEYYLQNLNDSGYTLQEDETEKLTGTTDTTATAEMKTFDHFTYNSYASTASGNIAGNGTLVLKVYYRRNKYTVTLQTSDNGNVSGGGTYANAEEVTAVATANLGYSFVGWYNGEEKVNENATYKFNPTQKITLTARFEVKQEMQAFEFNSTATTCEITNVKDKTINKIVIPDCVTSIGYEAFYDCDSLTRVTIPDSVTSIGNGAFYDCDSLTSITIPNSVTSIGISAFYDCDSLTSVIIPDSVTSIKYSAFESCDSLTSVTIPDSVTSIEAMAFSNCTSLTSITISDSVTSIQAMAFYNCTSLTSIKYCGTQAQWNAISKESAWNYNTGNYTITYNYTDE